MIQLLQLLQPFFSTAYGQIATLAGGVGVLWGLFKAIGAFSKWVNVKWSAHVKRRDAYQVLQEMIGDLKNDVYAMNERVISLADELQDNNESTSTLMLEKMMWAYNFYVVDKNDIPLDVQTALCAMFDQYKKRKYRNHVPENFKEVIMACPIAR